MGQSVVTVVVVVITAGFLLYSLFGDALMRRINKRKRSRSKGAQS
ncbi:MAG: hypothetical protein RSB91_06620 [Clostridia bacterium]